MAARVTLGIAALLLIGAAWLGIAFGARYLLFGEKAIGTVVALNDSGGTIGPVVEFATRGGETRRYEGLGSSETDYFVGDRVAIRYFDADPTATRISSSFHELWLPAVIVGIMGLMFGAAGLIIRRVDGRLRPPKDNARAQRRSSAAKAPRRVSRR